VEGKDLAAGFFVFCRSPRDDINGLTAQGFKMGQEINDMTNPGMCARLPSCSDRGGAAFFPGADKIL
jgi:hypothetical protein